MNNYELMVIFTPVLSEEDYKAVSEKIRFAFKRKRRRVVAHQSLGTKITGVSNLQKDNRSLLGVGVQSAIQLQ